MLAARERKLSGGSNARPAAQPRRRGRPPQDGLEAVDEAVMLSLAFKTFAERGYDGTTLRDLSKQLGVSHNLLNVRFGKKSDLWMAAVDWRLKTASPFVTAAFDVQGDDETRLRQLVVLFCRWATTNQDIVGLSYFEGRLDTWRLDYIAERFILPFKRRLDDLLDSVKKSRPVSDISTPALMAVLVQGVGYFFESRPLQTRLGVDLGASQEALNRQADLLAEFLLAGLLKTI
jgi:AcrR family transcriptional regulator